MTPDRTDANPDENAEHGVLDESGNLDTASITILGGHIAQVSVDLPVVSDDDDLDDDVIEDEIPIDEAEMRPLESADSRLADSRSADSRSAQMVHEPHVEQLPTGDIILEPHDGTVDTAGSDGSYTDDKDILDAEIVHEVSPERGHDDESAVPESLAPEGADSVSVEPVSVEPVSVQPVGVEPVSVEQVSVARAHAEPAHVAPERVESEDEPADPEHTDLAHTDLARADLEHAELARAEHERAEDERAEDERAEDERAEDERAEHERAEHERAEHERAEHEHAEHEHAEHEHARDGYVEARGDADERARFSEAGAVERAELPESDAADAVDRDAVSEILEEAPDTAATDLVDEHDGESVAAADSRDHDEHREDEHRGEEYGDVARRDVARQDEEHRGEESQETPPGGVRAQDDEPLTHAPWVPSDAQAAVSGADAIAGVDLAGGESAGGESAGAESAGAESAGAESAVAGTAGAGMAGAETAGGETADIDARGPSDTTVLEADAVDAVAHDGDEVHKAPRDAVEAEADVTEADVTEAAVADAATTGAVTTGAVATGAVVTPARAAAGVAASGSSAPVTGSIPTTRAERAATGAIGTVPLTRRSAQQSDEAARGGRAHSLERVKTPGPEISLTSKRLGEIDASRESADLLTADRLLDPRQITKPEPEGLWQQLVYAVSGRRINLGDGRRARQRKELDRRISTPLSGGARFVPVLSRKGGVGKTTVTSLLGMALADARDDRVIAVDANPDRGTLADRVGSANGRTVRDLVRAHDAMAGFNDVSSIVARDATRLDVLASDADPRVSEAFSDDDYRHVADVAAHYYSIVLTDTGTGIVHSVMGATLELADTLVIVAGLSVDEARLASETLTWLETNGYAAQVRDAVVVLNNSRPGAPLVKENELEEHFRSRVRKVIRMPYDARIAAGSAIAFRELHPDTRQAARELAAAVVEGLRARVVAA